jgi:hypothetical protein
VGRWVDGLVGRWVGGGGREKGEPLGTNGGAEIKPRDHKRVMFGVIRSFLPSSRGKAVPTCAVKRWPEQGMPWRTRTR